MFVENGTDWIGLDYPDTNNTVVSLKILLLSGTSWIFNDSYILIDKTIDAA